MAPLPSKPGSNEAPNLETATSDNPEGKTLDTKASVSQNDRVDVFNREGKFFRTQVLLTHPLESMYLLGGKVS